MEEAKIFSFFFLGLSLSLSLSHSLTLNLQAQRAKKETKKEIFSYINEDPFLEVFFLSLALLFLKIGPEATFSVGTTTSRFFPTSGRSLK